MLFLWGNSNTAKERYQKKVEDSTQQMEQWREGVSCFSLTHIKDCLSHQNSVVTGTCMHAALIRFQGVQLRANPPTVSAPKIPHQDNNRVTQWSIRYDDGKGASGTVGTDVVNVGGTSVTGKAVEIATTVAQQFYELHYMEMK